MNKIVKIFAELQKVVLPLTYHNKMAVLLDKIYFSIDYYHYW